MTSMFEGQPFKTRPKCRPNQSVIKGFQVCTLSETNIVIIVPENWWLEDSFPVGMAYCHGRAVSFGEYTVVRF